MTLFNLVHFSLQQAGCSQPRRWLAPIGLLAVLLLPLSTQSLAQAQDWGKWVEPTLGSDKNTPPGVDYDVKQTLCNGMQLAGRHAYWRCYPRCGGQSGG